MGYTFVYLYWERKPSKGLVKQQEKRKGIRATSNSTEQGLKCNKQKVTSKKQKSNEQVTKK